MFALKNFKRILKGNNFNTLLANNNAQKFSPLYTAQLNFFATNKIGRPKKSKNQEDTIAQKSEDILNDQFGSNMMSEEFIANRKWAEQSGLTKDESLENKSKSDSVSNEGEHLMNNVKTFTEDIATQAEDNLKEAAYAVEQDEITNSEQVEEMEGSEMSKEGRNENTLETAKMEEMGREKPNIDLEAFNREAQNVGTEAPFHTESEKRVDNLKEGDAKEVQTSAIMHEGKDKIQKTVDGKPQLKVIEIDDSKDWNIIESSAQPIIVDFYKPNDKECRRLYPQLMKNFKDQSEWAVAGANVDKLQDLAKKMKVDTVPTFFLVHQGRIVEKVGSKGLDKLIEKANELGKQNYIASS